jgi:hypothetical protein
MISAGTPLRRSARPGWYGSGCPMRARAGPSVLASWTAPSARASHSRGLAPDEGSAGTGRLTRTLAPGSLSLARLSMSFRISAERERGDSRVRRLADGCLLRRAAGELPIGAQLTTDPPPVRQLSSDQAFPSSRGERSPSSAGLPRIAQLAGAVAGKPKRANTEAGPGGPSGSRKAVTALIFPSARVTVSTSMTAGSQAPVAGEYR